MNDKKWLVISVVLTIFLVLGVNCVVFAETIDRKITNEEKKIDELNEKKATTDSKLNEMDQKISKLTSERSKVLEKKEKLEKDVNQLSKEIDELELKIAKRKEKIEEQARLTQANQTQQGLLDVLLSSESLSDAIGRTVAFTKLISTSNEVMQEQKLDQEMLETKKTSSEEKASEIAQKVAELKEQQQSLEASKKEQLALANEILSNLSDSKSKKAEYESQKEVAEQIKNENSQLAKDAAEQVQAAKDAAEEAQKRAEENNQLNSDGPVSLSKTTGKKGSADNSGANGNITYSSGFQSPLTSFTVSSPFGVREDPTGAAGTFHSGIDLAAPSGTPIMAARAGDVIQSGFESGAGNYVIIQHDNGYYTYYMHMIRPGISAGSSVSAGDVIGNVGTTGDSTGNHLHFGISTSIWGNYLDPAPFIGL